MRITIVIMTVFLVQVSAASVAQQLSLRNNKITLKEVFTQIRKQTGYTVLCESDLMDSKGPVSVNFDKTPLEKAIKELLSKQNLSYEIKKKAIIVTEKVPSFLDKMVDALTPPINVNGVVYDEKGLPLPGATVKVKGFKQSVVTDKDGKFYLPGIDDKAVLVVSYVGYADKEVSAKAEISVLMEQKSDELQEVVVAYGKQEQRAITGAVTVVKGEQIENLPNRSFDKSLQGFVPGLLVTQGSGQPGSGLGNFVLRGISTGGSLFDATGNFSTIRNPLIVMDGIPVQQDDAQATNSNLINNNPMAQLNPSDIESISVLKDASAIALYGSRASNGVILVTTKKGKTGKTGFNFRHQTDLSNRLASSIKPLSQQEYLELLYEGYRNSVAGITDVAILNDLSIRFPNYKDEAGNIRFYATPDWKNELFNKNATTFSNELSISGGNEKSNFYLNLGYTDQNGIQKETGYDRKSIRLNYENRPADWFKLGLNTTLSYSIQDYSSGASESLLQVISPLNAVRDQKGDYIPLYYWGMGYAQSLDPAGIGSFPNPALSAQLNNNRNTAYRGLTTLNAEARFLRYLTLSTSLGADFMLNENLETKHPTFYDVTVTSANKGSILRGDIRTSSLITTNVLRYDRSLGLHNFNLLVGQEAQLISSDRITTEKLGTTRNPTGDQLNSAATMFQIKGASTKQRLLSYFGQANYNFRNTYYLTGSLRTDGSSLFGDNRKFGTHWSVGAGWVLSEENFLKSLKNSINYLKLRGSMGSAGNSSAISNTTRYDILFSSNYNGQPALLPTLPSNPDVRWEKTFSWDAGLELRLLKERINITADFYTKKTSNLISTVNLPMGTGFTSIQANIGDIKNRGVELSVSGDLLRLQPFRWNLNTNWSKNKNTLTSSFFPLEQVQGTQIASAPGENYNSFYMPVWLGVNPDDGRPQWKGPDGNPTSDYSVARNAREFVGKPQPDGFGALTNTFSYRSWELSAMLYYQYGFKVFNQLGSRFLNDGSDPFVNQDRNALDRWQKSGDVTANPRRLLFSRDASGISDDGIGSSTRYLYDGDFIRLSNVSLSYKFASDLLKKYHLSGVRLFVQGHNLKSWTKYKGQDPESSNAAGYAGSSYPLQRSFTAGFNLNF
ncbi:SusC/RagA family TonB-linked outer membrane protein [Pedobacter sp. GR22-6]|uniref:SusC/RagA family TonB-linked outer membrane protein n=1 Tax=Pedobacter sp. GR22-6 TaxID=3127957 RepID=UPI00307D269B